MAWRATLDDLRRHIFVSLGVAPSLLLGACGPSSSGGDEGAGVTTDPSGDGSELEDAEATSGWSTSTGTDPDPSSTGPDTDSTEEGDGDGDPVKFDLPLPPDIPLPPPADCTVTSVPTSTLDEHPECPIVLQDPLCWGLYWGCVDLEPGQSCDRQCPEGDCVIDWDSCAGDPIYDIPNVICGPYEVDGQCCSLTDVFEFCGTDGRPFVVAGEARTAQLRVNARLDDRVTEHLVAHWIAVARAEHASIASFAQWGTRLLALAAPPALIRDALAAAADEVRHAELALAHASALVGAPVELGPLDTRAVGHVDERLEDTVLACVREGCIGETLAALELAAVADACADAELAATLRGVAKDELRHATLAWRFVRWALDQSPSLAPRVAAQFAALRLAEPERESFDTAERQRLRAHGCLPADERHRVRLAGVTELVLPCAAALFGRSGSRHLGMIAADSEER